MEGIGSGIGSVFFRKCKNGGKFFHKKLLRLLEIKFFIYKIWERTPFFDAFINLLKINRLFSANPCLKLVFKL